MKTHHALLVVLLASSPVPAAPAFASQSSIAATQASPAAAPAETVVQQEVSVRGTVTAIDVERRRLTLSTQAGTRDLPVDPGVAGLDRLRVGDVVDVRHHRSILFDIQPAGTAEPGAWISEARRETGEAGAVEEQEVTVVARVIEVDATAGTFTVQGPRGSVRTLHAERPEHRDAVTRIHVGDLLRVRFREGLAVSLAPVEMH